eukprot:GHVQ01004795.1.p1 GENE.GHVQ01004795.1~~GHVQ01004795.1.p1  ORF type:complete len:511 (-),score=51.68 GHVQ01004795.1:1751-3283(-)
MCWMHRGAIACAVELAQGQNSDKFLKFFIHMIQLLQFNGVTPVIVFDGDNVPAKKSEEKSRKRRREEAVTEGVRLMAEENKHKRDKDVQSKCSQGISITTAMIDRVIQTCRLLNIEFIVAPYEADAQLAYLCRTGNIAAVVTEDSDLLAYGCPRVVFKMDKTGVGQEVDISRIANTDIKADETTPADDETWKGEMLQLRGFNQQMFTAMCVLSGCDYIYNSGIKGIGIKSAYGLIFRYKSLNAVLKNLQMDPKWKTKIPKGDLYTALANEYRNAETVFLKHVVYDPTSDALATISSSHPEPPITAASMNDEELVGCFPRDFRQIVKGLVNPRTGLQREQTVTDVEKSVIKMYEKTVSRGLSSVQGIKEAQAVVAQIKKDSQPISDNQLGSIKTDPYYSAQDSCRRYVPPGVDQLLKCDRPLEQVKRRVISSHWRRAASTNQSASGSCRTAGKQLLTRGTSVLPDLPSRRNVPHAQPVISSLPRTGSATTVASRPPSAFRAKEFDDKPIWN